MLRLFKFGNFLQRSPSAWDQFKIYRFSETYRLKGVRSESEIIHREHIILI